ncbi:chaperonin 10-like protein [Massariosphaeria phaeospora]|uniref:Chaperonin 10-like protein n=1 Tax=Massariosphaeria phaeospora TaxID=100035 RepID=A0A7C8I3G4_9PLEO|nr:chaperonin 10-like protein [Massariosphaeria phaeospora]
MSRTMKAWQYISVAGGIEKNLHINKSAPKPVPTENEILVQVHVMALNPVDYKVTESGVPLRLLGLTFIPGLDFCGQVAEVGKKVDGFSKGEYVFGAKVGSTGKGTLAQYVAVSKDQAVRLPKGVRPEDAATIGIVGLTSFAAVSPHVKSGDKVFINGGSGGTGVYGVQIAKALGCHVTTSCSTPNVELCKSLGADEVIDYKSTDIINALSSKGPLFNLAVDNVGSPSTLYKASSAFIAPGGKFNQVGMASNLSGLAQLGGNMLRPGCLGGGKAKYQMVMGQNSPSSLQTLGEWMREGKVKSVIDSVFAWEDAPKAYEKLKTGRTKGKIIIKVPQDNA